ncbi:MAG: diguanylate cyclase [Gammaproteobacteria bacterium]|nr:diguanylate cyclase [Gammaproteobacteria bacterium]
MKASALIITLLLASGMAAANEVSHHPMYFNRISLDQGLSQTNVMTVLQDSRGLMWIGTENGLNSYNGYEFQHYKRERGNPAALGSDFIYDLAEDADGNLWVATNGGGLARFDRDSRGFASFRHDAEDSNSIASNVVRALLIDADGSIWIGTRDSGLDRFDPATGDFTHYRFSDSPDATRDANEIHAIYKDSAGSLWVGGNGGLVRLDPETGEFVSFTPEAGNDAALSDHRVRAMLEDSHGNFWIGTYGGGLNLLHRDTGSFEQFRHSPDNSSSIASDRITSIFEDDAGRLWIGTSNGLNLVKRDSGTFIRFANDDSDGSSLADNKVTTIFQDRGGLLWVGTRNQGLNKWDPRTWSMGRDDARQLSASGSDAPNVTSFVEDAKGTLWVGTFGEGLNAMDRVNGTVKHYRHEAGNDNTISDDRVMSLMLDRAGMLWIGTMTAGVNVMDTATGEIEAFRHDPENPNSIGADGIMAIFQDSNELIWVGTFGGGIARFDTTTGEFTRFQRDPADANSLSSNRVTSFAEDRDGNIWVGTDAGGLNLFNPRTETFHHYRHDFDDPNTLASDTVYSLTVDNEGTVWVGTQGGGLDRVVGSSAFPENIRFANISQVNGLTNDVIYGVQADQQGTLWLSTNYGISRMNPQNGAIRNLHVADGLQSEEFNFGAHYRSDSGELFFGGHNGFNAFNPAELRASDSIPLVALTGMFVANEPIKSGLPTDPEEGVEFTHKDEVIGFEFAALDFAAPGMNRYMYKLEGFDKDWIDLGNRRRITYTNLDDGNYLLRVKAANSEGVWNDAGFTMPITVKPALWDTWWAYLGYFGMAVMTAAGLFAGHRRKIRREEEYSRRLEKAVHARTEDLIDRNMMLKKMNQSLQESSLSDPLTGLRNRRFVFEEVSRDLEVVRKKVSDDEQGVDRSSASDLVFMMIDLDHFKPINDTYGHAAGDKILLEVRDVLLGTCRKSDIVVRWGGDEFVVIAKQTNPGEAEALAERIRASIAAHNFELADGQIVKTTCSIGFAAYPLFKGQANEADLDQILNLADSLMYEAKKKRNAWAGMLTPSEAATSFNFDHDSIEPTSMLFRARHVGGLSKFQQRANPDDLPRIVANGGQEVLS